MSLQTIKDQYDLIVIGGGITGAGILREAVRMGLNTLLLERKDFAWGTSSRSSKLVHGGLRYLKEGRLHLTYESVTQRQRLLTEAPGLVEELGFLVPIYDGIGPGRAALTAGLTFYDLMAGKRYRKFFDTASFARMVPRLKTEGLLGGYRFMDAQVDDARLVQRLLNEAGEKGGTTLNYTEVTDILWNSDGKVCGVTAEDTETGESRCFSSSCVINATGSWAEKLHPSPESGLHLRPLRGSHLMIPSWRLPLFQAVTLIHPDDGRPLFIIPWEGALMLGTTDIDHGPDISGDIVISRAEADYMITCLEAYFPTAGIGLKDCIASYAGIRPVLSKGGKDPSRESREHVVWRKNGLVTVTGGKMTTFRALAADALKAAAGNLPKNARLRIEEPAFEPPPALAFAAGALSPLQMRRLYGRYGKQAQTIILSAETKDFDYIPGTCTLWAELPALAASEQIRHLTDLLLRRVRIGLLTPDGGRQHLDRIQALCEPVLDWDSARWKTERKRYIEHWEYAHRVPQ